MQYHRIWRYVAETPWAMTTEKLADVVSVLVLRASGGHVAPEEIAAVVGEPPAARKQGSSISVVPLRGMIAHRMGTLEDSSGGMSVERFVAMMSAAFADPSTSSILIDVDSPGGTVPGVHEAHAKLLTMKGRSTKRVVALANNLMASAAYWLATVADEIISIPSGTVGSIGVFSVHEDLSKRADQLGIKISLISAGKYKTENNPFEPLTEEGRAQIQSRVDASYDVFTKDVAKGRRVKADAVRSGFGQGRALSAKDALAAGMIDRVATVDQVIASLTGTESRHALRAELDRAKTWAG